MQMKNWQDAGSNRKLFDTGSSSLFGSQSLVALAGAGLIAAIILVAVSASQRAVAAEESNNLTLPTDRTLGSKFSQLPTLIEKGQFNDVTQFLGNLLGGDTDEDHAEDTFYLDEDDAEHPRGLKAEAQRLLGLLPEKGRAAYQLQFGVRAEKLLGEAIESGSLERLAEVSRRFFHTTAGYQATYLIGMHDLDHGHPLAAAQCFEILLATQVAKRQLDPALSLRAATSWIWAGRPERARQILLDWKKATDGRPIVVGGKSVPLFTSDAAAVIWLSRLVGEPILADKTPGDSWSMYRGDASRNGQTQGGTPLFSTRWRVRIANDPIIERLVGGLEALSRAREIALIPAVHPLAVGNIIVTRSVRDVMAIDFESGKRLWEVRPQIDDGFDRLIKAGHNSKQSGEQSSQLVEQLGHRLWDDTAYGTLSTDGERVFVVQDLSIDLGEVYGQGIFFGGQVEASNEKTTNRLVALSLNSGGQTLWEVGGANGTEESLEDAFFLGAPLPLEGRLYALAEARSGIRLVVLEADSGKMVWSQQLADVELNIGQHAQRRLSGASPSYGDGVLICPIGAGAVVAVDVSSRALKWAFRYAEKEPIYGRGMFGSAYSQTTLERDNDRWIDNSATIVGDKVILTPVESSRMFCLNLFDGSTVWESKRRGDNLYVACVHQGNIILVGTEHLTAIDLADGGQGWPNGMLSLPPGSVPSGRGFYSGKFYYLPLSTAEVAKIDLETGKLVESVKSRDGHIPGNLICHEGMVLSQNVDYLYKYFQLEPLETWVKQTLAKNPHDAVALLRQGQLELEENELPAAISFLRRAYQNSIDQKAPAAVRREAKETLVHSLMEGLRLDFASHRESLKETKQLADQPDQQTALLRLEARGLQKVGETEAAFQAYLNLLDLEDPSDSELEQVTSGHQSRRDRWIAAQLAELYQAANAATRKVMEATVSSRIDRIDARSSLIQVKTAYLCFSFHPRRAEVALKLCDRLLAADQSLAAELLLEEFVHSSDIPTRGAATARLAQVLKDASQFTDAIALYRELNGPLAEVVCQAGRTGAEIVAALPEKERLAVQSKFVDYVWPKGEIRSSIRAGAGEQLFRNSRYLEMRGETSPYFHRTSLALDQQPIAVVGFDGLGGARFRIPLQSPGIQARDYDIDPSTTFATGRGRLLLVSMGNEIVALDALHTRNAGWQNVLWKLNLNEFSAGLGSANSFMHLKHVRVPGGPIRVRAEDGNGNPVGNIGPIGVDTVILQRQDALLAVHSLTGEILWIRRDLPRGCDLFGDDELLLAVPPNSTEARVFRTTDGGELGTCAVASESKRVATLGRKIVAYSRSGNQHTLALIDPWAQKTLWSVPLQRSTQIWNVQSELVGAMEPSGRFRLFQMADGLAIIDQQLEPEPRMDGILIYPDKDQYTLITHRAAPLPSPNDTILPVPGEPNDPPLLTGRVYAFHKTTGEPLWQVPATIRHRGLHSMQHADLPVLVFVQNVLRADSDAEKGQTTVMCLDKRTGEMVYRNDSIRFTPRSNFDYQVEGFFGSNTITISLPTSTITLTLTEQPVPPEPPEQESASAKKNQPLKGVFGIIGSTLKALGTPPEERADDADLFPSEKEAQNEKPAK
jgi:outer membrane protein assembly factor BamB